MKTQALRRLWPLGWCMALVAGMTFAAAFTPGCAHHAPAAQEYTCPMHPAYVTNHPGDCPICNMRLVPRVAPDSTRRVDSGPAAAGAVAGHADVTMTGDARQLSGVQTAAAVREHLARRIRTVGIIVPDETRIHHMHVKVGGFVESLLMNVTGQRVRQGEPAFTLYSPELLASQEELLHAGHAVAELLPDAPAETRRGAQDLLDAARHRLELLDVPADFIAGVERSGHTQRAVTFSAPVSGYVTMKNVIEGQQVEPGSELFAITDLSHVWVEADFYENEAHLVAVGQTAELTLPYDPGTSLAAKVTYIYPYVDAESRTLKVRFDLENPRLVLKPSMYVDVWLSVQSAEGVVIPESAVLDSGERQIVFVETRGDRFEPRNVKIGLRSGGRVQVLSGVEPGENVVVRANFLLDSESRLRGALAKPEAAAPDSGGRP
jgi:Cu(I)/Ag(I) efflux system membrane fusion protein